VAAEGFGQCPSSLDILQVWKRDMKQVESKRGAFLNRE
jgi:hypothetical protein